MRRRRIPLATVAVWLGAGLSAQAQSVVYHPTFFNFDYDSQNITIEGSAQWQPSGGDPASGGYLSLAQAQTNEALGVAVFPDPGQGMALWGVTVDCQLRIGGGTNLPMGGLSLGFARAGDPAVLSVNQGVLDGFATGPDGQPNLPEEGTTTGFSVFFDTANGGGTNTPGLGVRVDNRVLARVPLPTLNGNCDDPASIQTGPPDPLNPGSTNGLCWQPFHVELLTNGLVNVAWKNHVLITNLQASFPVGPCRLVLASRTGGAAENYHLDNLLMNPVFVTAPAITFIRTGNQLTMWWSPAGGTLQSADDVTATNQWTNVATGNSAVFTIAGPQKYYRVRQ